MVEKVENPHITSADWSSKNKRPGLGAFVRLKNEQDFARASIESILPFFDQVVVTYNECTDDTPDIVAELEHQYPNRIKAYHYLPSVVPAGTDLHRRTPSSSPHSMAYYSNFAMSKVSFQIRCKWDGDQIAEPKAFGQVVERLRGLKRGSLEWWLSPWRLGYWWYQGINLWDQDGEIYVMQRPALIGRKRDHGFWGAGQFFVFKKDQRYEYLFTRLMRHQDVGCIFYHLRGLKRDRGITKFQLEKHPESSFRTQVADRWVNPPLFRYQEFQSAYPNASGLPDPETLGIRSLLRRDAPNPSPDSTVEIALIGPNQ